MNQDNPDNKSNSVDVICQFCADGRIIPIRIRLKDDYGEYHAYTIKKYRDLSHRGVVESAEGVNSHNDIYSFDCVIDILNEKSHVRLFYKSSAYKSEWSAVF